MNLSCPHVHYSYATWRLQLFQRLCIGVEQSSRPTLSFLYPQTTPRTCHSRRDFHATTRQTRNNVKDIRRSARFKAARSNTNDSTGIGRPVADRHTIPEATRQPRHNASREQDRDEWNPYSDDSIAELQDLVSGLRAMADQAKEDHTKDHKAADEHVIPFEHGSQIWARKNPRQPESPLEHRLPWDREKKLQVRGVEIDKKLENNVWAQILASPVRLDRGTKARLPKDLMVSWGPMRNPSDGNDYLLPIELSDLEGLHDELEAMGRPDKQTAASNEGEGATDAGVTKSQPWPRVSIAPNRLLLEAMIDDLMHERLSRGKDKAPTIVTNSAKVNATLVPFRWRYKQAEFEAFYRTRKRFNEVLGRESDADEPDLADKAKLETLQWQPDIAQRIEKIMRKRVLIALEALGRDNASGRVIHDRRVQALPVPRSPRLYAGEGWTLSENKSINATGSLENPTETTNQKQDLAPAWVHGAVFLYVGHSNKFREIVEQWHRLEERPQSSTNPNLEQLPTSNFLPPMVTINDQFRLPVFNIEALSGPEHASETEQILQANKTLTLDFWTQHAEKPRSTQSSSSLDSQPATSPLDAGEQVLSSIVTPNPGAQPDPVTTATSMDSTPSGSPTSKDNEQATSYLLLIKPRAKHASVLARELWQYWRYIGGKTGLHFEEG